MNRREFFGTNLGTLAALFCATSLQTGCNATPIRSEDVQGVWQLDHSVDKAVVSKPTLTLKDQGSFVADALPPGLVRLEDAGPQTLLSGSGTWSLRQFSSNPRPRVVLTFDKIKGYNGRGLPYGAELFTQGAGANVQLFYSVGDPDENHRVIFQRQARHA
jgi:hypothetical protein